MNPSRTLRRRLRQATLCIALALPSVACASFSLDYVAVGRIWAPRLEVDDAGLPTTQLSVVLRSGKECDTALSPEALLQPQERDCRFEQQLRDALSASGIFARVLGEPAEVDLVLVPRRSRLQFTRSVMPVAKPFVVLSFFTYLWTPLPYEVDVESYELSFSVLSPSGEKLSDVVWSGQFQHYLGSYSAEHDLPNDLSAQLSSAAEHLAPDGMCRGPHAGDAAHELFLRLGAAAVAIEKRRP